MADQAEIGGVARAGKPRKQKEGVFISYARRDGLRAVKVINRSGDEELKVFRV